MMKALPLHDVGHNISPTRLFIGMEFSPSNKIWKNQLLFILNKSHFFKKLNVILGEICFNLNGLHFQIS